MLEQLIEFIAKDPLLETPYLRRMREKGFAEGHKKGIAEGCAEGLLEGVSDVIRLRFTPSIVDYRRVEQRLAAISDIEQCVFSCKPHYKPPTSASLNKRSLKFRDKAERMQRGVSA